MPTAPQGPLVVVYNPRSGRHTPDDDLPTQLKQRGRAHELYLADGHEPLPRLVQRAAERAQAQGGVLVAAGGDGTINAVAQAAVEGGLPFGVLPRGTFNYFARRWRLPLQGADALAALDRGRLHPVQVGEVNGHVFLVNASLGLYAQVLRDRERYKQQYGRSRPVALWAALMTLLDGAGRLALRFEHEGQTRVLRSSTLFVGNNELQLERLGLEAANAPRQGKLAAVCVKPGSRSALLGIAVRAALGRLGEAEGIEDFEFRELEVTPAPSRARHPVRVAYDGEGRRMQWPLRFAVSPRPLHLLLPAEVARQEAAATRGTAAPMPLSRAA